MKLLFAGFATVDIIDGKKYCGGAAGMMSINATHLGVQSSLITVLSRDTFGTFYSEKLSEAGVHTDLSIHSAPSIPTCIIDVPQGLGSKRKWHDNGSLPFFKEIPFMKDQADTFDGIFISNALPDFAEKIAQATTKRMIYYTPGPQVVLQKNYIRQNVLTKTKVVFCNEEESTFILKKKPFQSGVELVVVTRGENEGTVYKADGTKISFMPPKIDTVIDPTGAGDAFALGFGIEHIKTDDISPSIQKGLALAARVISRPGGLL